MEKKHFILMLLMGLGITSCHGQLQTEQMPENQTYTNYLKNYLNW